MARIDTIYGDLSKAIIDYGYWYKDESRDKRCKQISSAMLSIPLNEFPLLTTKKMFTKGIVGELIWFLRGDDNIKYLVDNGINIWNEDALVWAKRYGGAPDDFTMENFLERVNMEAHVGYYQFGEVGRNYGVQWTQWTGFNENQNSLIGVNQFENLIENLKKKPIGRRHIVTAWNPAELDQTALPPCHWAWEVLPRPLYDWEKEILIKDKLDELDLKKSEQLAYIQDVNNVPQYGFDLKWHQRSVDTFLGLPFNIASYALLANIIGKLTNFVPLNIIGDLSNVHFYEPHIEVAIEQLQRDPNTHQGPTLKFSERFDNAINLYHSGELTLNDLFNSLEIDDFIFEGYTSFDKLKADMFAPITE